MANFLHVKVAVSAGLLAAAFPLLGAAQSFSDRETPQPGFMRPARFYVGLEGSTSLSRTPDGFAGTPTTPTTHQATPLLPKLTLGWQLGPRLALQVSTLYAQQNDTYYFSQASIDANGQPFTVPGMHSFRFRSLVVPVLARYTLSQQLHHRFQADLLAGATLVHRFTRYHYELTTPAAGGLTPYETDRTSSNVHLTLGPSFRYQLCPRLDASADVVFNYLVGTIDTNEYGPLSTTKTNRSSASASVGLRYHFSPR